MKKQAQNEVNLFYFENSSCFLKERFYNLNIIQFYLFVLSKYCMCFDQEGAISDQNQGQGWNVFTRANDLFEISQGRYLGRGNKRKWGP